jgi:hypothetical protein
VIPGVLPERFADVLGRFFHVAEVDALAVEGRADGDEPSTKNMCGPGVPDAPRWTAEKYFQKRPTSVDIRACSGVGE